MNWEEALWMMDAVMRVHSFELSSRCLNQFQVTVINLNGIWIWNDYLLPFSDAWNINGRIKTLPVAVLQYAAL